jgi:octaprenyl-diphosphate synthase
VPLHTPTGEKAKELIRQDVTRRVDAGSLAVVAPSTTDSSSITCASSLRQNLGSDIPFIEKAVRYLSEGGGKRVRPALLAVRLLGHDGEEEVTYAALVQPIHTATLIHDAVIDHAALRRGQSTLNDLWGTT